MATSLTTAGASAPRPVVASLDLSLIHNPKQGGKYGFHAKENGKHEKTDHGEKAQRHPEKAPAYVPDLMARGIGAAVCLFLALMVVLGMVGIHAVVPDLLCRGIRGLVG